MLSIQKITPLHDSIAIDSLKKSIASLQIKVDSVKVVATKADVAKSFFQDILGTQLFFFSCFLGVLALISWGVIWEWLREHQKRIEMNSNKLIDDQLMMMRDAFKVLEQSQNKTSYDLSRSTYLLMMDKGLHDLAFSWALKTSKAIIDVNRSNSDQAIVWLKEALIEINTIDLCSVGLANFKGEFQQIKTFLEELNNQEITEICNELENIYYRLIYTPSTP